MAAFLNRPPLPLVWSGAGNQPGAISQVQSAIAISHRSRSAIAANRSQGSQPLFDLRPARAWAAHARRQPPVFSPEHPGRPDGVSFR